MSKDNGRSDDPLNGLSAEAWLEWLLESEPQIEYGLPPEAPPDEETIDEVLIEKDTGGVKFRLRGFRHGAALGIASWLIDGILPSTGASMLFAPSGIGKTWLGLDWAVRVASGMPWLGRHLSAGSVVYVAAEGAFTIPRRTAAITSRLGIHEQLPIFTVSEAIIFNDDATHPSILADALRNQLERWDWPPPALVIVDTYTACVRGSVNDDDVAAAFMRGFRRFLRRLASGGAPQPAGLIIHHPGLQDADRPRGSSAFPADLDCMMMLEEVAAVGKDGVPPELGPDGEPDPEAARAFLLRCAKMRQGPEFEDVPLALKHFVPLDDSGRPVEIGGEKLTGLVVDPVEGQVVRRDKKAEARARREAQEANALSVLHTKGPLGSEEWRFSSEISSHRAWDALKERLKEKGDVVLVDPLPGKKRVRYAVSPQGAERFGSG